ncbi:MAG: hypothetical protein AABP62_00660 [Planctomycetota bacterium]
MAVYRFSLMRILSGVLWTWLSVVELQAAEAHSSTDWPAAVDKSTVFMELKISETKADHNFEPSGATVFGDWLYVVSDNGKIGRQRLGADQKGLQIQDLNRHQAITRTAKLGDLESITTVPGDGYLYLGVEGDGTDVSHARIVRYVPPQSYDVPPQPEDVSLKDYAAETALGEDQGPGQEFAAFWELSQLPLAAPKKVGGPSDGMEAMTFIPDGFHPFDVANEKNRAFAGIFLTSSQGTHGTAYAFDLKNVPDDGRKGTVTLVGTFEAPLHKRGLSDLFFSKDAKTLFALYDEGTEGLQELLWTTTTRKYIEHRYSKVGFRYHSPDQMTGVEAVALSPDGDLYLALDQAAGQAKKNDNCTLLKPAKADVKQEEEPKCIEWNNYVYRYSGFRPEFPNGLPDISGMVLIEQDADSAKYLLVRDIKSHKPGSRLLVLTVSKDSRQTIEPVAVDDWKDKDGRPSDLEGVCKLPNTDNGYLLLESGYWTGEDGKLSPPRFGRIFYVELADQQSGWAVDVKKVAHLAGRDTGFRSRDNGGKFYLWDFEGIACPRFDPQTKKASVLLANRVDGAGEGEIHMHVLDLSEDMPITRMTIPTLATKIVGPTDRFNSIGGNRSKCRQCTDLYLEPTKNDPKRFHIWTSSSYDPDLDGGPFYSHVYLVGRLVDDANGNLAFRPYSIPVYWTLEGVKVEALGESPNFWKDPVINSRIIIGTDDEHLGGTWRPLKTKEVTEN